MIIFYIALYNIIMKFILEFVKLNLKYIGYENNFGHKENRNLSS